MNSREYLKREAEGVAKRVEIKPCPFCGDEKPILQAWGYGYRMLCYCSASGPQGIEKKDAYDLWNRESEMRSLLERDLDYFATDESDILITYEARCDGERRRRTDEADGFYQPGEGDMERPEYVLQEHLDFLDDLRSSGACNMFGAGPDLQNEFRLDKATSYKILSYWMASFGDKDR